jgi:glucosamine-6-phosphate deaminase
LKIVIKSNAHEAVHQVADQIANHLIAKPDIVMGLATGETMRPVYSHLCKLFEAGDVPSASFTSFNLDEFSGVPPTHPGSFNAYMVEALFTHIANAGDRCFLPDGMADDPEMAAAAYEAKIAQCGGIDLQLLGIGRNGHIGFNEPGTPFDSRTASVDLSQQTREVMTGFASNRPYRAITMGIGTIMEARHCLLLATGEAKAAAVSAMLSQPPSPACPASALQAHPDLMIVLDRQAASRLTEQQLLDADAS